MVIKTEYILLRTSDKYDEEKELTRSVRREGNYTERERERDEKKLLKHENILNYSVIYFHILLICYFLLEFPALRHNVVPISPHPIHR